MILNIHCDGSCYHVDGRMGMGVAFFYNDSEKPFHTIAKGGETTLVVTTKQNTLQLK